MIKNLNVSEVFDPIEGENLTKKSHVQRMSSKRNVSMQKTEFIMEHLERNFSRQPTLGPRPNTTARSIGRQGTMKRMSTKSFDQDAESGFTTSSWSSEEKARRSPKRKISRQGTFNRTLTSDTFSQFAMTDDFKPTKA